MTVSAGAKGYYWEPPKTRKGRGRSKRTELYGRAKAKRMARVLLERAGWVGPATVRIEGKVLILGYLKDRLAVWWGGLPQRRSSHRLARRRMLDRIQALEREIKSESRTKAAENKAAWDAAVRDMAARLNANEVPLADVQWALREITFGWHRHVRKKWPRERA